MKIGIPKEVKAGEGRVALTPDAVAVLVDAGNTVFVQQGAGVQSGYQDSDFHHAGATINSRADELYGCADVIIKVKEPQKEEWPLLQKHHTLFCYLHLAAFPALTQALQDIGLCAIGFETVEEAGLPLLAPMSEIAGKMAIQTAAMHLQSNQGGKGVLLGGAVGVPPARVLILGAGVAGLAAAGTAHALGADVTLMDVYRAPLERAAARVPAIKVQYSSAQAIGEQLPETDVLIGAVLVPGARAPRLVTRDMVATMKAGSVVLDIAVDQGGCIETTHPTSWHAPAYEEEGVIHLGVANLPGAVPRTASRALSGALLPWVKRLQQGLDNDPALHAAVNIRAGEIVHAALKQPEP